jgi:vesicle coat complex subunit
MKIHRYQHVESPDSNKVQLQILTAIVKLFLKRPKDTQEMVQKVLNLSTQETDNPDLRDRGYVYWRLLSTDPEAAKVCIKLTPFNFLQVCGIRREASYQ